MIPVGKAIGSADRGDRLPKSGAAIHPAYRRRRAEDSTGDQNADLDFAFPDPVCFPSSLHDVFASRVRMYVYSPPQFFHLSTRPPVPPWR